MSPKTRELSCVQNQLSSANDGRLKNTANVKIVFMFNDIPVLEDTIVTSINFKKNFYFSGHLARHSKYFCFSSARLS